MLAPEFKEWRKKLGLTQEDAAARIFHVSRVTVQNWETGATPISRSVEVHCQLHLQHWEQEQKRRPNYGPVKLYCCRYDGRGISPEPKIVADNETAIRSAMEVCSKERGLESFITTIEGDDIWNIRELKEEMEKRSALKDKDVAEMIAKLNAIADHFSSLPVLDDRTPDEIIGYNERGHFD